MTADMPEPDWQRVLGTARAALATVRSLAIVLPWPRTTTAETIQCVASENVGRINSARAVIFAAFDVLERELRE